jgi:hypothetical protein
MKEVVLQAATRDEMAEKLDIALKDARVRCAIASGALLLELMRVLVVGKSGVGDRGGIPDVRTDVGESSQVSPTCSEVDDCDCVPNVALAKGTCG